MIDGTGFLIEICHGEGLVHIRARSSGAAFSADPAGLESSSSAEHSASASGREGGLQIAQAHRGKSRSIIHLRGGDIHVFHDGGRRGRLFFLFDVFLGLFRVGFFNIGDVDFLDFFDLLLFFKGCDRKKNPAHHHDKKEGKAENGSETEWVEIRLLA